MSNQSHNQANQSVVDAVLAKLKDLSEKGVVLGRAENLLLIDAKKAPDMDINDFLTMSLKQSEGFGFMSLFTAVKGEEYLMLNFLCMRLDPIDRVELTDDDWPGVEVLIAAFRTIHKADDIHAQKALKTYREAMAELSKRFASEPLDLDKIRDQIFGADGIPKKTTLH